MSLFNYLPAQHCLWWILVAASSSNFMTLDWWREQFCSLMCCLAGSFKRRKRKSIIVTVMLLIVSVLILIFGLAATTRTQNITVGGYYPGVIVSAHSHLRATATGTTQQARSLTEFIWSEVWVKCECLLWALPAPGLWWTQLLKVSEGWIFPTFIIQHRCH